MLLNSKVCEASACKIFLCKCNFWAAGCWGKSGLYSGWALWQFHSCLGLGASEDQGYCRKLFVLPPDYWKWKFFYIFHSCSKHCAVLFRFIFKTRKSLGRQLFFQWILFISATSYYLLTMVFLEFKNIIQLKGTVTKDINIVRCLVSISFQVVLDNDIVQQRKFTLFSKINHSEN